MYQFSLRAIYPYLGNLPSAILLTIELTLLTILLSSIVGIGGALLRRSSNKLFRLIGTTYVEVVRNMPILILLYLIYFGLPAIGWRPSSFLSALVAMTLNSGAFMTEIFRAGLIAIPQGQYEAARSQGMMTPKIFRYIILPQVLRVSFAPLGNQLIGVIMSSSIASVIAVEEITSWMYDTGSATYRYIESVLVICVVYIVLCQGLNLARNLLGRYLFKSSANGGRW